MDFRIRRQLIVMLIVLGAIAVPLAYAVYRYTPRATCFDNVRNQREEDVDCGGPCMPCALKHPQDLSVFWVRFVQVRENTYDVVAEVRNPNIKLGAPDLEYDFRFYDDAGVEVAERLGHSFIFPGETIHLLEANIQTQRTLSRATLDIANVSWRFTDRLPPDVVLGDKELRADPLKKSSALRAVLVNRSLLDFQKVFLVALILDAEGNVIAASKITEENVRSGQTRPVVFLWPLFINEKNPTVITEVRINTLVE